VRYLVAVYWAEGASDGRILIPIVERALEAWLLARARGPFDLLLQALSPLPEARTFVERVASLVQQSQGGYTSCSFTRMPEQEQRAVPEGSGSNRRCKRLKPWCLVGARSYPSSRFVNRRPGCWLTSQRFEQRLVCPTGELVLSFQPGHVTWSTFSIRKGHSREQSAECSEDHAPCENGVRFNREWPFGFL